MKGTKRFAVSESNPSANDSVFWNKKVTVGSAIDAHRTDIPQQQLTTSPPLDLQRAESSRQHVRALNTQFASWIQMQLKNHPDELWEDGIRDYLAHASNIMEKFADVVTWLQANATKGESLPASNSQNADKKSMPEVKSNEIKPIQGQTGVHPASTTSSFASSWSSGSFSNNQNSKGIAMNNQSSGVLSNSQSSWAFSSSPVFSNSLSPGLFSSGSMFSNSQSSGVFSSSPSFGLLSASSNSGISSNSPSSGVFSNSQSSVLFSNNQSSGFSFNNQSSGLFSNSQSSGLLTNNKNTGSFSNNQSPLFLGSQISAPATNCDASDDVDDENEEQPSSPSVKKQEEKGVVVVHEVKCKLYVKSSDPADKDPWKDKGTGQLTIRCKEDVSKGTKESKPTILVRNDVGRILLNALLYPGIKTNTQKNSIVAIFHTAGDGDGNDIVTRTFLIRLKTEDDRNNLATAIQEYAPSS